NNDNITDDRTGGDVDADGIVDYPAGPDCWLNTTIPSWYPPPYAGRVVTRYICPIGMPPEEGVDVVYAYIDADNSSTTGLWYDVPLPDAAVALFPIGAQAATNAVINEISPQPNPEWVELANPTGTPISLNGWNLALARGNKLTVIFAFTTQTLGAWGSGQEYLSVPLPGNSLPNGNAQLFLQQGATIIDQTTYSSSVGSGLTWARFKDPITGRPMDTNNDAVDFYVSLAPSPARGNDR